MRVLVGTADIDIDWLLSPSKGPCVFVPTSTRMWNMGPAAGPGRWTRAVDGAVDELVALHAAAPRAPWPTPTRVYMY